MSSLSSAQGVFGFFCFGLIFLPSHLLRVYKYGELCRVLNFERQELAHHSQINVTIGTVTTGTSVGCFMKILFVISFQHSLSFKAKYTIQMQPYLPVFIHYVFFHSLTEKKKVYSVSGNVRNLFYLCSDKFDCRYCIFNPQQLFL